MPVRHIILQQWQLTTGITFTFTLWEQAKMPHQLPGKKLAHLCMRVPSILKELALHQWHPWWVSYTMLQTQWRMLNGRNLPAPTQTSASKLRTFNQCHIYLQVVYLLEITTADGFFITRDAWTGDRNQYSKLLNCGPCNQDPDQNISNCGNAS